MKIDVLKYTMHYKREIRLFRVALAQNWCSRKPLHRLAESSCLILLLYGLSACSTLEYYRQSACGHLEVMNKSRPIPEWLREDDTPEKLKQHLETVQEARQFAVEQLALPDNDSYRSYADLNRPYVIWSVFVAREFSLEPVQSCFPIIGCLAYRGYFAYHDAVEYAESMKGNGYDVHIVGIAAYSTLGWFDDPVLNTMMHWQEHDLVGLLFHELAHQKIYIKGDTGFNEAFASTVEQEGLHRWMESKGRVENYEQYKLGRLQQQDFVSLLLNTRSRLEKLYERKIPDQEKRQAKREIFRTLRSEYRDFRKKWDNFAGYDHLMFGELNNAVILSIVTYHDLVPAFERLLKEQGGDFRKFYQAVEELGDLGYEERHKKLRALKEGAR